jgi:preprotein translocase subunit SecF
MESDSTFEKTVFLNWQDVTSQSPPVKYNLQIASNVNFTTLALEKSTLPDSEYYISEEEELELLEKGKTYYWRVQAFDSANNYSEWSSPSSFTIATSFTWPGWATYLLIGIVVIIIVYFAFRFGKRMALQPPD